MAVTATLPGLPSGLGATVIQSNALTIPAGEYTQIDWATAQKIANDNGRDLYVNMPNGKVADPNWRFYIRADMTGTTGSQKTLIAVQARTVPGKRGALNTTTMQTTEFKAQRRHLTIHAWHIAEVTLTNLAVYLDVVYSSVSHTVLLSPESGIYIAITNGYQSFYEACSLLFKPVAASAPVLDPLYAALAGLSPNV